MSRYQVTYHDEYTGREYTVETFAFSKRSANHNIYNECGDVEIIDTRKVNE